MPLKDHGDRRLSPYQASSFINCCNDRGLMQSAKLQNMMVKAGQVRLSTISYCSVDKGRSHILNSRSLCRTNSKLEDQYALYRVWRLSRDNHIKQVSVAAAWIEFLLPERGSTIVLELRRRDEEKVVGDVPGRTEIRQTQDRRENGCYRTKTTSPDRESNPEPRGDKARGIKCGIASERERKKLEKSRDILTKYPGRRTHSEGGRGVGAGGGGAPFFTVSVLLALTLALLIYIFSHFAWPDFNDCSGLVHRQSKRIESDARELGGGWRRREEWPGGRVDECARETENEEIQTKTHPYIFLTKIGVESTPQSFSLAYVCKIRSDMTGGFLPPDANNMQVIAPVFCN
ncbi:hypothetical protein J6590_057925 [Homalodisca vitripennis]|nr:hypothetical protein J6590_057925 [Homalodisca vitripennis]